MGPMSDVVLNSTQHLSDADLAAMATYLQALPPPSEREPAPAPALRRRAPAARRCTRTTASPATASAARACRARIRRSPAAAR